MYLSCRPYYFLNQQQLLLSSKAVEPLYAGNKLKDPAKKRPLHVCGTGAQAVAGAGWWAG
jgi:hypothetical protein